MTRVAEPAAAVGGPSGPGQPPDERSGPSGDPAAPLGQSAGWAVQTFAIIGILLGLVLAFGVFLYGLSSLSEQRTQTTMYKTLRHELATAIAPISATGEGKPMAVLDMPSIGVKQLVVVEGTTSRDLTRGPGHRPDTVYPGQAGTSIIYGKVGTFGAPFANLMHLRLGDVVTVTTGQGAAQYKVTSFGNDKHPPPANSPNRLVLTTANSALLPRHTVSVSADLVTPVKGYGGPVATADTNDRGLIGDMSESIYPLVLWSQALLLLAIGGTIAAFRWSRWPAVLVTLTLALPVLWEVFTNISGTLPNLF